MTNAYHRLSLAERRKVRESCQRNLLYVMLYQPLWHQRGGDLPPEDVWAESVPVAKKLHGVTAFEASMKASEALEDLCDRYTFFEDGQGLVTPRVERAAQHSAMMVLTTVFFILLNEKEDLTDNPNRFICKALKDVLRGIDGFLDIYEGARKQEDALEYSGRFIEACNLLEYISVMPSVSEHDKSRLHEVMGVLVDETLKATMPTIEEQERLMARVNDKTGGSISKELDVLRISIDKRKKEHTEPAALGAERVAYAVDDVQEHFWAKSSWAVVFCVWRDLFGGTTNISQFEREVQVQDNTHHFNYNCPDGTISRTISNNPYMKKHVDKWVSQNAPNRVMDLVQALKTALENTY